MDQSQWSGRDHVSVLSCFPPSVGRDVAVAVVKPLGAGLGNPDTRSLLHTDTQVKWTMEVLCYGLTLPLDGDTVKLCVDVYTDWLMALVSLRDSIPPPISREPDLYVQKILRHLYSLFMPRSDQVSPVYLSLCQQVLCAVQTLARESAVMSRDTWEMLLHFLLRVNHAILAPPTATGGVSEQLSQQSMAVLFEVWLLSCSRCFPSRSLWLTGRQMLSSWRHQPAVVEQWSRVIAALTSRLLLLSFGPSFPQFKVPEEDATLIPADLQDKRVSHTWFRFLHLLSNPMELSQQKVVGSTPPVQEEALLRADSQLTNIFFRNMRAVSTLVDAFLGLTTRIQFRDRLPSLGVAVTRSPFKDRLPSYGLSRPRSGSAPPTPVNILSVPSAPPSTTSPPSPNRRLKPANVSKATSKPLTVFDSLPVQVFDFLPVQVFVSLPVQVFDFLPVQVFDSLPVQLFGSLPVQSSSPSPPHWKSYPLHPPSSPLLCSAPRPSPSPLRCNVDSVLHLFGYWLFDAALVNRDTAGRCDVTVMSHRWAAGRAEACGTLCRVFTCKKTAEDILPVYLSRFYLVLLQGLQVKEKTCPPVQASILLNSTCLFCCDLKGVNLLLPSFVSVLENILLDRDLVRFKSFVSLVDLRRSSILVLLSLLPLPLQFPSVQSQVLLDGHLSGDDVTAGNFLSLKPRLISVLIGALHTETDASNTQILLAAILNLVQDSALLEAAGRHQDPQRVGASRPRQIKGTSGLSGTRRTRGTTIPAGDTSAGILWVQFVHLLTQRLTAQWRNDSAVCLSALETLGGLAKVEVCVENSERRRALTSVCSYIVFQCSRPPQLHSRDLHSIIVAAFHCLNVWITEHPALLDTQECLLEVLEIVELGISGSKSRQEEEVRSKEDKDLNPASLRVKEAAEATLSCVMQVSGAFPFLGGRLDEDSLTEGGQKKKFRYFVVDSSVILALLEPPPGPEPGTQPGPEHASCPSLTALIRGPSGQHAWTLQLHLQPREGRAQPQQHTLSPNRCSSAAAQEDAGIRCDLMNQLFPEIISRIPPVKADLSVPGLHENLTDKVQQQLDRLRSVFKRQQQVESQPQVSGHSFVMTTCRPSPPVTNFQTARLFLSHLGLLTPETLKDPGTSGVPAQLVSLDSSIPGFSDALRRLDNLPFRNCDSASVFYMRARQRTAAEILRNVESSCSALSHFLDFLSSLGHPVEVGRQQMGGASTNHLEFHTVLGDSGGGVFNGQRFVLRYMDALSEITFIVPSSSSPSSPSSSSSHAADWLKRPEEAEPPSELQSHSESCPVEDMKSVRPVLSLVGSDSKVLIVWVECFEDIESFPLRELLSETQRDTEADRDRETPASLSNVQLIFIHPLETGLYRIRFHGNTTSKFSLVVPLVNGSVVSKRSLGFLVRETVINCCHRRRLESDSAPPPHVRRKHLISDIIHRYRSRRSEPTFYSALFHDP
ncbi:ral GTPase-activating protein subunit beta [Symphorus nematophorus]